jgi:hypothetical protein
MTRLAAFVLAAVFISLAGCSSDQGLPLPAPTTRPATAASSVTLQCVNGMGTHLRGLDVRPVLGVVALPTSPSSAALGTGRVGDPGLPGLFAKSALVVRSGSSFMLKAGPASRRALAFSWNPHPGDPSPTRSLVVKSCHGSSASKWLAFVGGYYVDRPSCVDLIVTTGTGTRHVKVGVGAPAQGSSPPSAHRTSDRA